MKSKIFVLVGVFAMANASFGQFFSNRSLDPRLGALNPQSLSDSGVAAPTGGFWSEVQHDTGVLTSANNTVGVTASQSGTSGAFRIADDFTIAGGSALLRKVRFFVYQLNASVATPVVNTVSLRIWSGRPGDAGSTVVWDDAAASFVENASFAVSASGPTVTSGNVYRIFNSVAPAPGITPFSNRPVHEIVATLSTPQNLAAGTYWIDYQVVPVTFGASIFSPLTTHSGFRAPQNPAGVGNARQLNSTSWIDIIDGGIPSAAADINMEVPFLLDGECTLFPVSYTIDQGLPFGGNLASLAVSDDDKLFVLLDEFSPNSMVSMVFDTMTSFSGTTYVGNLTFQLETRSARSDQVEFLKVWNNVSNTYESQTNWFSTIADTQHSAVIMNAADFVDTSHLIRVQHLVIPSTDIESGDGWINAIDMANIVCGP